MKGSVEERFWAKVNKTDGCWLWTAGTTTGYGSFHVAPGNRMLAHRWSYESLVGPIPAGLVIDHLCRNPPCVNPDHLQAVTDEENRSRGAAYGLRNGMRTACINGHEFTEANTYYWAGRPGWQMCRECHRTRQRVYHHRNKAARAQVLTFTEVPL